MADRRKTLTRPAFLKALANGQIRKAFCTEVLNPNVVWYDHGRGRQHRLPYIINDAPGPRPS